MAGYYDNYGNWINTFGGGRGQNSYRGGGFRGGRGGYNSQYGSNSSINSQSGWNNNFSRGGGWNRGRGNRGGGRGGGSKPPNASVSDGKELTKQQIKNMEKKVAQQKKNEMDGYYKTRKEVYKAEGDKLKADQKYYPLHNLVGVLDTAEKVKKNVEAFTMVPVIDKGKVKTKLAVTVVVSVPGIYEESVYNQVKLVEPRKEVVIEDINEAVKLRVLNSNLTSDMGHDEAEKMLREKAVVAGGKIVDDLNSAAMHVALYAKSIAKDL